MDAKYRKTPHHEINDHVYSRSFFKELNQDYQSEVEMSKLKFSGNGFVKKESNHGLELDGKGSIRALHLLSNEESGENTHTTLPTEPTKRILKTRPYLQKQQSNVQTLKLYFEKLSAKDHGSTSPETKRNQGVMNIIKQNSNDSSEKTATTVDLEIESRTSPFNDSPQTSPKESSQTDEKKKSVAEEKNEIVEVKNEIVVEENSEMVSQPTKLVEKTKTRNRRSSRRQKLEEVDLEKRKKKKNEDGRVKERKKSDEDLRKDKKKTEDEPKEKKKHESEQIRDKKKGEDEPTPSRKTPKMKKDKKKKKESKDSSDDSKEVENETFPINWEIDANEITFDEKIGEGTSCIVYKGTFRGQVVALKRLKDNSKKRVENFIKEFAIISQFRSPHVVYLYGGCKNPIPVMALGYCPHGSLYDVLRSEIHIDWSIVIKLAWNTLKGLVSMHNWVPQIVHRDLKSRNILVEDDWQTKLCDFGESRYAINTNVDTLCKLRGTYAYIAPEIYFGLKFTPKSDVYALGIILWELCTRCVKGAYEAPYSEYKTLSYDFQIIVQASKKGMRPKIDPEIPTPLANVIMRCWDHEPNKRPDSNLLVKFFSELNENPNNPDMWSNTKTKIDWPPSGGPGVPGSPPNVT